MAGRDGRKWPPMTALFGGDMPGGDGRAAGPCRVIYRADIVAARTLWQITHLPGICRLIMHLTKESNDLPIGDNGAADA